MVKVDWGADARAEWAESINTLSRANRGIAKAHAKAALTSYFDPNGNPDVARRIPLAAVPTYQLPTGERITFVLADTDNEVKILRVCLGRIELRLNGGSTDLNSVVVIDEAEWNIANSRYQSGR